MQWEQIYIIVSVDSPYFYGPLMFYELYLLKVFLDCQLCHSSFALINFFAFFTRFLHAVFHIGVPHNW